MSNTEVAAADRVLSEFLSEDFALIFPLPPRVPCAVALEREAIAVRDYIQAATAKAAAQLLLTVRPARCTS